MTTMPPATPFHLNRRIWLSILAILAAGICLTVFLVFNQKTEPSFEGRSLSEWLVDLRHQSPEVRQKAIGALQQMGPKAASFLIADLNRDDSALKARIVAFLKKFPSFRSRLMTQSERHQRSIHALRQVQPYSKEIIAALSSHMLNTNTAIAALNALYMAGQSTPFHPDLVAPLAIALKNPDVRVRRTAAVELRHFPTNSPQAVAALQVALGDTDNSVRLSAALSLVQISTKASVVIPAYAQLLERKAGFEKIALKGIARFESEAAEIIPLLIRVTQGDDVESRRQAVYALGRIHSDGERVLPLLVGLLEDADALVGRNAAYAIGAFGNEASNAVPALIKAVESRHEEVRAAAAYTLKNMLKVDSAPKRE